MCEFLVCGCGPFVGKQHHHINQTNTPKQTKAAGAGERDIGRDTDAALVAALADLDSLPATAPVMGGHGSGAAAAAGGGEFGARLERLMDLFFRHARRGKCVRMWMCAFEIACLYDCMCV
jgi:hypothetical protein